MEQTINMNYNLLKQLKDEGFKIPMGANELWQPSLSELIEACGDRFYSLVKPIDENPWSVTYWNEAKKSVSCAVYGSTPEEALANLWIELNKGK